MREFIKRHETTAYVAVCGLLIIITLLIPGWTGVMR